MRSVIRFFRNGPRPQGAGAGGGAQIQYINTINRKACRAPCPRGDGAAHGAANAHHFYYVYVLRLEGVGFTGHASAAEGSMLGWTRPRVLVLI